MAKLQNSPRWRFVEMGGSKLIDILGKTNPWSNRSCGREDCQPCNSNPENKGVGACWSESCTYKISCKACRDEDKSAEYIGETARTFYSRSKEHYEGLKARKEDNILWNHCQEIHGGVEVEFKFELLRKHKTCFNRQVTEGVFILNNRSTYPMNRKQEFNSNAFPELLVEEKGTLVSHRKRQPDPIEICSSQESPNKRAKHSIEPKESNSGSRNEEATASKQNNLTRLFDKCRRKAENKLNATPNPRAATPKETDNDNDKNQGANEMSLNQKTNREDNRTTNEPMESKNDKDRKQETIVRETDKKHEESDLDKLRRRKKGLGIYSKRRGSENPKARARKLKRTLTTVVPTLVGQRKINDIFTPFKLSTIDHHKQLNQRESPDRTTLDGARLTSDN